MRISKYLSWAGLSLGIAFLLLQSGISLQLRLSKGDNLLGALWFLLSFFTILTNIGIVLVHVSARTTANALNWFRQPYVRSMFAVLILVVMLVYYFVLAQLWQPEGLMAVADIGLHYVTPLLYLAWWLLHRRIEPAHMGEMSKMLVVPLVYLVWALVRGLIVGEYPYPFINLDVLGWSHFLWNATLLFVAIAFLYGLFIALEKHLPAQN
ncbi:Pr6Pr family membrane protein [Maritalea mediterranea]|uniref:Pr6Pr family membrane protein n=1 Tax=Maritalea mediterranea TaxID=2909667 RepID=A0ABS9E638_9HYPH|nr:Pr6Pr family membrane protein [Maritalea mediterranea]MCF4098333.1 Pr6Pr family membrane protein [Maritalea mediterranea]